MICVFLLCVNYVELVQVPHVSPHTLRPAGGVKEPHQGLRGKGRKDERKEGPTSYVDPLPDFYVHSDHLTKIYRNNNNQCCMLSQLKADFLHVNRHCAVIRESGKKIRYIHVGLEPAAQVHTVFPYMLK